MLSFLESFPLLACCDMLAASLVAIGCIGELRLVFQKTPLRIEEFKAFEEKKHFRERVFVCMVAIGVTMELALLPLSLGESARLHKEAAEARRLAAASNERSGRLELARIGLEKQLTETKSQLASAEARLNQSLLDLEKENLPMDIGEQYSFATALKPLAGIRVKLRSAVDAKAQRTAELLSSTFAWSGWQIIDRAFIGDVGEEGIVIGCGGDVPSVKAARLLLKQLIERSLPSVLIEDPFGLRVRGVPTNAIIVAVMQRPSKRKADLMIARAKEVDLRAQSDETRARIMELGSKRFVPGSKELMEAQTEFNSLALAAEKLRLQEQDLDAQEASLWKTLEEEEYGTNAPTHGFVLHNPTFSGVAIPLIAGTNVPVNMHGARINPPPLQ